jgi:hypothetical protein
MLNRDLIIVKYKQPFVDWINEVRIPAHREQLFWFNVNTYSDRT